ncbi:MAG: T9SS type A sorting domain-containing protein [Bacteroidota bacterium]
MTKFYQLLLLLLCCTFHSFAQQQIENGDFENWSAELLFERPDDWVIGADPRFTSVVTQSDDAFSQNFSAKITTQEIDGEVAIGGLVFGFFDFGIEDFLPVRYESSVDSFIVHLKYDIQPGDTGIVLILQRINGFDVFSFERFTGKVDEWTRVAIPMTSTTQDSILIVFSPSDILAEEGEVGSVLFVDEMGFVDANTSPAPLPNSSFENWTAINANNPDNWDSFNRLLALADLPPNVTRSDEAASGSFSARLEINEYFGDTVEAFLVYGSIDDEFEFISTPFTGTPTRLTGSYRYQPAGQDVGAVVPALSSGGTFAGGEIFILTPTAEFIEFEIPIVLSLFPDTLSLIISAGQNPGSVLWIDNLAFDNVLTTEEADLFNGLRISPNPASDWFEVDYPSSGEDLRLKLMDIQGRILQDHLLPANQGGGQIELDVSTYIPGIYVVEISQGKLRTSRKVTIK